MKQGRRALGRPRSPHGARQLRSTQRRGVDQGGLGVVGLRPSDAVRRLTREELGSASGFVTAQTSVTRTAFLGDLLLPLLGSGKATEIGLPGYVRAVHVEATQNAAVVIERSPEVAGRPKAESASARVSVDAIGDTLRRPVLVLIEVTCVVRRGRPAVARMPPASRSRRPWRCCQDRDTRGCSRTARALRRRCLDEDRARQHFVPSSNCARQRAGQAPACFDDVPPHRKRRRVAHAVNCSELSHHREILCSQHLP